MVQKAARRRIVHFHVTASHGDFCAKSVYRKEEKVTVSSSEQEQHQQ